MNADIDVEINMCDECISHLMENAGPDHIIVKYRQALAENKKLEQIAIEQLASAEEIKTGQFPAPTLFYFPKAFVSRPGVTPGLST